MYVCLCKGVTDSQISRAVAEGVTDFRELRQSLGLANQCGKCGILAREIFQSALADNANDLFYPAGLAVA